MLHCGLRVSEVCDLKPGSFNWKKGEILVMGKGKKERMVPIYKETIDDLDRWKKKRPKGVDWFFATHKGGRINRNYLYQALKRYANRAISKAHDDEKLDSDYPHLSKIHPHMLRHTCGTIKLHQFKGNLRRVQKLLGHELIETTAIYTHLDIDDLRLDNDDHENKSEDTILEELPPKLQQKIMDLIKKEAKKDQKKKRKRN